MPLDDQLAALHATFLDERPVGADEDVHMVASTVDHVIERCSAPGDMVLDPFAGFGTTLARAVALGRRAVGVELLPERVELVREYQPEVSVFEGDARELIRVLRRERPDLIEQPVDLVLTSPPYMTERFHGADPLTAYELDGGDYRRYLNELELVAAQCARLVKPGGYVVWNVADIHHLGHTTHLVDDCRQLLARHLTHVGTTEIVWDQHPHDLVADALLVFQHR